MKANKAVIAVVAAMALGMSFARAASAQSGDWWSQKQWGGSGWGGTHRPGSAYAPGERDRVLVERTCNGRFMDIISRRVERERQFGRLRRDIAERMRYDLRRLDDRGRQACRYRDWRGARDTGDRFMQISHWIDRETGRGRDNRW